MKKFDNYIFDLYGTLVDIHTDEDTTYLWNKGAQRLNNDFGTNWIGKALRERYLKIADDETMKLKARNGAEFPEILIETVWVRLINEGREIAGSGKSVEGEKAATTATQAATTITETSPELLDFCVWFRETSRSRFKRFDGVLETFEELRRRGKKIFLLSNAQRAYTEKELKDADLFDKFDDIFISSDKQIKKPQKEFLQLLVSKNGLSIDKCVMIGNDIFSDVGVAVKNGMNSIFLNTDGYSKKKIDEEIKKLGIKGSCLVPTIIDDGDIRKIL